jgi:hypothetical protein
MKDKEYKYYNHCGNLPKELPTCYATDTKAVPLQTVTEVTTHIRINAKIRL